MGTDLELAQHAPARAQEALQALTVLRGAIAVLDEQRAHLEASGDMESLAWGLDSIRTVLQDLQILAKATEKSVANTMSMRQEVVEGLGTLVSRAHFGGQKWDSEGLLRHLVARALFDPETGELLASTVMEGAEVVANEVAACVPLTASLGWRVGALRERGINPDDWREREYRGQQVQIVN